MIKYKLGFFIRVTQEKEFFMSSQKLYRLVVAALLCAVGILIPMFSPIKITIEPASFTLASHVAIFLAMFVSPSIAVAVSVGTTLGFFLAGFPITVVMRAASHIVFALLGSLYIQKHPETALHPSKPANLLFSFLIGILHGLCEVLIILPFYFGGSMASYEAKGFFVSVILLVGVGSAVHSMIDFTIASVIWAPLRQALRPNTVTTAVASSK